MAVKFTKYIKSVPGVRCLLSLVNCNEYSLSCALIMSIGLLNFSHFSHFAILDFLWKAKILICLAVPSDIIFLIVSPWRHHKIQIAAG